MDVAGPSEPVIPDHQEEASPAPLEELDSPAGIVIEPTTETQIAEPENNTAEENTADSQFGGNYNNHINQPLRRSARIPNARPRELYPGSVKYV